MQKIFKGMPILFLSGLALSSRAQLSLTGQLRTRTELRDGYGTLEATGSKPAFLTSQRARLNFNYRGQRVIFQASVQDVRVWGADASTINNADGTRLSIHEAWAEIVLANKADSSFGHSAVDYFGVRIGRQELVYDDQRLLGNLDWLQQGRRHDAVVFRLQHKGWQADLGAAFNQNTDAFNYNGTYYTPANLPPYIKDSKGNLAPVPAAFIPLTNAAGLSARNGSPSLAAAPGTNGATQDYKSMQYLYVARNIRRARISGLVFADEFGKYRLDSARSIAGSDTGYLYGRRFNQAGVNARVTAGLLSAGTGACREDFIIRPERTGTGSTSPPTRPHCPSPTPGSCSPPPWAGIMSPGTTPSRTRPPATGSIPCMARRTSSGGIWTISMPGPAPPPAA
jgi:hypothetical protein